MAPLLAICGLLAALAIGFLLGTSVRSRRDRLILCAVGFTSVVLSSLVSTANLHLFVGVHIGLAFILGMTVGSIRAW